MHGVGYPWIRKAFEVFNHHDIIPVPSQYLPDHNFPTVSFPNPEERGAMDESTKFAHTISSTVDFPCDLIIANDPDADRLAVCEKLNSGVWHTFSGNEIGVLLGYWQIYNYKKDNTTNEALNSEGNYNAAVLASVVSSRMLKAIAAKENVQYFDTLTGI